MCSCYDIIIYISLAWSLLTLWTQITYHYDTGLNLVHSVVVVVVVVVAAAAAAAAAPRLKIFKWKFTILDLMYQRHTRYHLSQCGEPSTMCNIFTMISLKHTLKFCCKGKGIPHYRPWRPMGDVVARVHIFTATALGWGRVVSPTLGRLYPRGNSPVLIL